MVSKPWWQRPEFTHTVRAIKLMWWRKNKEKIKLALNLGSLLQESNTFHSTTIKPPDLKICRNLQRTKEHSNTLQKWWGRVDLHWQFTVVQLFKKSPCPTCVALGNVFSLSVLVFPYQLSFYQFSLPSISVLPVCDRHKSASSLTQTSPQFEFQLGGLVK